MTDTPKRAKKKKSFKQELLDSSISKRISITTLSTYADAYKFENEKTIKAVLLELSNILPALEVAEVKDIFSDIIKLIDYGN